MPNVQLVSTAWQGQKQAYWCCAAVAASTHAYYAARASHPCYGQGPHLQCDIMAAALDPPLTRGTCCTTPTPSSCVRPSRLDWALQHVGCYASRASSAPLPGTLLDELIGGRPVCGIIAPLGGGIKHAVIAIGFDSASGLVTLHDPARGPRWVPYSALVAPNSLGGCWRATVFTV
jgi:hypothetical protein